MDTHSVCISKSKTKKKIECRKSNKSKTILQLGAMFNIISRYINCLPAAPKLKNKNNFFFTKKYTLFCWTVVQQYPNKMRKTKYKKCVIKAGMI